LFHEIRYLKFKLVITIKSKLSNLKIVIMIM